MLALYISALEAADWQQLIYRSALYGRPLPALANIWTHGAASGHTTAPTSHT